MPNIFFHDVEQFSDVYNSLKMSVFYMFRIKRSDSGSLLDLYPKLGMYYGCFMGAVIQIFMVKIVIPQFMNSYDRVTIAQRINA